MKFYFYYVQSPTFITTLSIPIEIISSEDVGHGFKHVQICAEIHTDVDAMALTKEYFNSFGIPDMTIDQIKQSCAVSHPEELTMFNENDRNNIFQFSVSGDWQYE